MGPVTTNPYIIALINMTIVFGVLISIGIMMQIIYMIDPTKKKVVAKPAAPVAKAAAPAVAAAPVVNNNDEIVAVIAAAVAACGCSADQIASIRRIPTTTWTNNARAEVMNARKECF